jgi:preprotein translocase subunit SecB
MKINIVSNRVLGMAIRQQAEGDSQRHAMSPGDADPTDALGTPNTSTAAERAHSLDTSVEKHEVSEKQALFGARVVFSETHFFVIFKTEILTDERMCIDLEYESRFEVNVPLDDSFKDGNFPYVNAPAIAYPYLRAFISNLTLNSGFAPVMLPSLNFVAMKDRIRAASR